METRYDHGYAWNGDPGVEQIATELLSIADKDTTRQDAARIVCKHGFAAFIGGHHVAIHPRIAVRVGPRLAIVTHDGWDWD